MKLINFSFKVYNVDRTKNGEVIRIAPLEVEINRHKVRKARDLEVM